MIFQFEDSGLMFFKLLVFLVDLTDCDSNNVDHIAKDSSTYYLNDSDHKHFYVVVWSEVPIPHCHHCGVSPVVGINVDNIPGFTLKISFLNPVKLIRRLNVGH